MRKAQREPWLAMVKEIGEAHGMDTLCNPCRYAVHWEDHSECNHALADHVLGLGENTGEPGEDCWAFRPKHSLEVSAAKLRAWIIAYENGWYADEDAQP